MDPIYRIRNIIHKQDRISIKRFMEEVNSCNNNYYNNNIAIGKDGDFITSPEISQLFGEMIGLWCVESWYNLNCPKKVILVEFGPGNGTLMDDILRSTKHIAEFHNSIEIYFLEISQRLIEIQRAKLAKYKIAKTWYKSISEMKIDNPVIFLNNEFFDALPIDIYKKYKKIWYQRYIEFDRSFELKFIDIEASNKTQIDLDTEFKNIIDNGIIEISEEAIQYITYIANSIKSNSGYGVIIDYGYNIHNDLRILTSSTLQAVKNHSYSSILSDIGNSDLSAHVDFYNLSERVKLYGLQTEIYDQGSFLMNLGINIRAELLTRNLDREMRNKIYIGLDRLISDDKMGKLFKVMTISNNSNF